MIIAIIPARGGSKRILRKNLITFCDKPLIYWSIKQALDSELVNKVYVSTEDKEIAQTAKDYGADIIDRPSELAQDDSTLEEVLFHAMNEIKDAKTIIVLQPTNPLRMPQDIDDAISKTIKYGSTYSIIKESDLFLWDDFEKPVTFTRKKRKLKGEYFRENGSIYCFDINDYIKFKDRYGNNFCYTIQQKWQSFEIDTLEDIEICEYFMRKKILKN